MKKRLFLILAILFFAIVLCVYISRTEIKNLVLPTWSKITQQAQRSTLSVPGAPIKITFLDIGQGDASFIEWGDGTQMLIDCAIDSRILEALGRVMKPLDHTLDYLVVTHPDQDHYGGCVDVMKRFEIKHIVYTGYQKTNQYFPVFFDTIQNEIKSGAEFIEINHEQSWNISSSTVHFLFPDMEIKTHPLIVQAKKTDPSNNTSLIMILQYGKEKVMFTGDAEFEEENYLLKKYAPDVLDIDVLKVGHHGSAGSTSDAFLQELTPTYAVISAGKDNKYGHPTLRTLRRLERSQATILRTDTQGDILFNILPDTVYVENKTF